MPLLEVNNLTTAFATSRGEITAVEDVSFSLNEGEILGIVGESGSGKSVTALTIMGLLPQPPARVAAGEVRFGGEELTRLSDARMQRIRGPGIAMVFQEPMTSLNPVFTIGEQVMETSARMSGCRRRRCMRGRWKCWSASAFPRRRGGWRIIRISFPAGSGSG